jgi:hypothetical protein
VLFQPLKPGKLVIELRARLRIAVRQVETANENPFNRGFDVPGLFVSRIARQRSAG